MHLLKIVAAIMLTLLFTACKSTPATDENDTGGAITFEERIFNMESSSCKTNPDRCAKVALTYPVATDGDAAVIALINDTIMKYVSNSVAIFEESADGSAPALEAAAAAFIGEYEIFLQEEPEYEIGWAIETTGKVLYQSAQYLTVEISNYTYAGGAHPNTYVYLLNFDPATGALLDPMDKISDVKKLMQLAETKFRVARDLPANADLVEEGYFWDGAFILPQSIGITAQGLYFFYNAYEVAPYVAGPTEFTIPYEELKGIWQG